MVGTITADNTLDEIIASIDDSRKQKLCLLKKVCLLDDPNAPRFDNLSGICSKKCWY